MELVGGRYCRLRRQRLHQKGACNRKLHTVASAVAHKHECNKCLALCKMGSIPPVHAA
jgi:hypothetical protein